MCESCFFRYILCGSLHVWELWSGESFGCTIFSGVVVGSITNYGISGDINISVHPELVYALLLDRKFVMRAEVNHFEITLCILLLLNLSVAPLFQKYEPCNVLRVFFILPPMVLYFVANGLWKLFLSWTGSTVVPILDVMTARPAVV